MGHGLRRNPLAPRNQIVGEKDGTAQLLEGEQPMANPPAVQSMSRELVKEIAMDIGKEVAAYVERMYPEAVTATSSTFLLSLRNDIYNEIIGALDTTDEKAIIERLSHR